MKVMHKEGMLGLAREALTKPMLKVAKETMRVEEVHNVRVNDVLREFASYAGQRNWSIVQWRVLPGFKTGTTFPPSSHLK